MAIHPTRFIKRREFLGSVAGAAIAVLLPRYSIAAGTDVQTHTYKAVGNCAIKADVHGAEPGARKPALLNIHGGALIMGNRKGIDSTFYGELIKRGFVVVSIDYRLAPETKLPAIIEDVQAAWKWVQEEGPKRFGIDAGRVAVSGGSAGGYLTLMTGFCVEPRPRALVPFWGYGELTTPWYAEPNDFYRRQPLVTKQEAYAAISDQPVSDPPPKNQRGRFYLYCRQNGIWCQEVAGHDPKTETKWFDPYCPLRNVTAKFPPTHFVHGTNDTDVPYSESKNMADKLTAAGVEHDLITVEGAGHGLSGAGPDVKKKIAIDAAAFVESCTK